MADATTKLSGYLASASAVAWASGQTLASLTDNEWTDLTDEIDNSTTKYMLADWELVLGSAAFTGVDSAILIYLVKSMDGTNYPTWASNVTTEEQENEQYFISAAVTTGATGDQRITSLSPILLPNGKFKFGFRNATNVALAASGNAFSWRPHSFLADEA